MPPYEGPDESSERTPNVTEATVPAALPPGDSRTVDLGGPVHYIDFGGPEDGPTIVRFPTGAVPAR